MNKSKNDKGPRIRLLKDNKETEAPITLVPMNKGKLEANRPDSVFVGNTWPPEAYFIIDGKDPFSLDKKD